MLFKIGSVSPDHNLLKLVPREYEETVVALGAESHHGALEMRIGFRPEFAEHLVPSIGIEFNINKRPNIELPHRSIGGLHLHGQMAAMSTGSDDVVMGNIARE